MPKCSEVAAELRRVIEALESTHDADCIKPILGFFCYTKAEFLTAARVIPRPFKKSLTTYGEQKIDLSYGSQALLVQVLVPQNLVCELIEPAKPAVYRCEPLLSEEEDAAIATEEVKP